MKAPYRISALARGFLSMWRAWHIILPTVIVNALLQGVISSFPYSPNQLWLNIGMTFISAILFIASASLIISSALLARKSKVSWSLVWQQLKTHGIKFALYCALVVVVGFVGLALWTWPGIIVFAATPFVMLAALAGEANPLKTNFFIVGRLFWRWLVTALIVTIVALLSYYVLGFVEFFLRGVLGASVIYFVVGIGSAWFFTAWSLIFARYEQIRSN